MLLDSNEKGIKPRPSEKRLGGALVGRQRLEAGNGGRKEKNMVLGIAMREGRRLGSYSSAVSKCQGKSLVKCFVPFYC